MMNCAPGPMFFTWVLLVCDFSKTLLTRVPGSNVFNIRVAEVGGKPVHDGILTAPVTIVVQRFTQVVLMLAAQVGVDRLDAFARFTVTGVAYRGLALPLRRIAAGKCDGWHKYKQGDNERKLILGHFIQHPGYLFALQDKRQYLQCPVGTAPQPAGSSFCGHAGPI